MRRIGLFVAGALVGAAAMYTALTYHILRADDGFHLVPKMPAHLGQTYLDIRGYGVEDWRQHSDVALAIVKADKEYLLADAVKQDVEKTINDAVPGLNNLLQIGGDK